MTIVGAWVRRTRRGAEELLMVSDSRLNGGGTIDSAPKLFLLPRSDCVIGFSGNTLVAYPLLTQLLQSIDFHSPLRDRVIDYVPLRTHLVRLVNELFLEFDSYLEDVQRPDTSFLLGGYSWFNKRFCIDRIFYNIGQGRFQHRPSLGSHDGSNVAFIGDWEGRAKKELWRRRHASGLPPLHMEPFEIVRDLLRAATDDDTIGGAPQLVSVSQHMNSRYLAVKWPDGAGDVHLGGRRMLKFENFESWIVNPDTLDKDHLHFCRERTASDD